MTCPVLAFHAPGTPGCTCVAGVWELGALRPYTDDMGRVVEDSLPAGGEASIYEWCVGVVNAPQFQRVCYDCGSSVRAPLCFRCRRQVCDTCHRRNHSRHSNPGGCRLSDDTPA